MSRELDPERVEQLKRIKKLYIETQLTVAQIASEVGLDSAEQVKVLWTIADQEGVLDELGL